MSKQQQLAEIVTPHDHDVLSGRGNFVNYHSGNEHFRALVRKHKVAYVACPKPQKGKFSKMIVDEIRSRNPPGRFLKQDPATKLWYEIGEKKALDKTRQALREGAPEIMKELSGDPQDEDGSGAEEPEPASPNPVPKTSSPEQAPSPSITSNIGAYAPTSAGIDGSNHFHDSYSPPGTTPVAMLNDAPGSSAAVFAQSGMPVSHMPQSNRTIRTERMMQAAQAMAGAQNINPQHVVNPLSHPGMPMQQQPNVPERGIPRHVSAPSGLSLPGHGNNLAGNIHNPDPLHQTFSNLHHSVFPSTNEFEPRPIDPNLNNKFQQTTDQYNDYSEYNDSWEPERVAPLPPRKPPTTKGSTEGRPRGLEREASEKSLKVDNIFGGGSKKYQDHQGSSAHLSVMSLSIGDMHSQVSETTNPDDLAPLFNTSLRVGGRRDATSRLGSSVNTGFHSSLGHVMDMSVATLGDRLSDFGEASIQRLTESTADMSFSNVFEDKDREMYVNNQR